MRRFCFLVLLIVPLASSVACGQRETKSAADYISSGKALYDKGDYDGAIADYTKAIELNAKDANAYNSRREMQ